MRYRFEGAWRSSSAAAAAAVASFPPRAQLAAARAAGLEGEDWAAVLRLHGGETSGGGGGESSSGSGGLSACALAALDMLAVRFGADRVSDISSGGVSCGGGAVRAAPVFAPVALRPNHSHRSGAAAAAWGAHVPTGAVLAAAFATASPSSGSSPGGFGGRYLFPPSPSPAPDPVQEASPPGSAAALASRLRKVIYCKKKILRENSH